MFEIVETCITLSGEAPNPGEPVFLIRFTGCNLDCSYCDTPYKDEVNETMSLSQLEQKVLDVTASYPGIKVLFTGGEPLLGKRGDALKVFMKKHGNIGFFVETNGSVPLGSGLPENCCYVVDWKAPSSKEAGSFCKENLQLLRGGRDCIKIVVSSEDLEWVKETVVLIHKVNPGLAVYLSPQWESISLEALSAFIIDNRLRAFLSVQLHKIIWGNKARGV